MSVIYDLNLKEPDSIISYSSGNMAAFKMMTEWAERAFGVAEKTFIKNKDKLLSDYVTLHILFRSFPPFSEPAPYSHEQEKGWDVWKGKESCCQCPFSIGKEADGYKWIECVLAPQLSLIDKETGEELHWPPNSMWINSVFCRFTQYRHLLFRKFDLEAQ